MTNKAFIEEDGSQDHLIGDKVLMTAKEVELHISPPKTAEQIEAERKYELKEALAISIQEYAKIKGIGA